MPQQGAYSLADAKPIGAFSLADAQPDPDPPKGWPATIGDYLTKAGSYATGALPAAGGALGAFFAGPPGAAAGGAAGVGYRDLLRNARELPGAISDVAHNLIAHPVETAQGFAGGTTAGAGNAALEGGLQGAVTGAGNVISAGASRAASRVMQSAVKPGLATLKEYGTSAPAIVKTLFDEGVNVTQAGITKLQALLGATNDEIRAAVQNAPGSIDKNAVAARVLPTAAKVAQQVNPAADLRAVGKAVTGFIDHPTATGPTLSVPEAQAMKVGTYEQIGKKYGEVSAAGIEAQKALARGLKEEIEGKVPFIASLNQKDASLMAALDAVGRRVALSGNRDPVGFAWVAHNPMGFLAALMDREPVVKSMLARGMYASAAKAGKVSEAALRLAVSSLASASTPEPGGEDRPE